MQYEAREKALRDIESIRDDALEEGKLEGKKEGRGSGFNAA
jgi:flagellar biosynthesis/type III secretory pathway protein FliH